MTYKKTITLTHEEIPAKVNIETGEVIPIKDRPNNIPKGKIKFIADELFAKSYTKTWLYLYDTLSAVELKIALKMSMMTEMNTNSLNPLDDKTSLRTLASTFNISTRDVKKSFKRLFDLGIYASFHYCHYKRGEVKEWVFNPYISFKGKLIDSDIKDLFDNTIIGKLFNS